MEIVLYSTNCPKCKMLEKQLDKKQIKYMVNTNTEEMLALGMRSAPNLSVDGKLMDFSTAWKWIAEVTDGN